MPPNLGLKPPNDEAGTQRSARRPVSMQMAPWTRLPPPEVSPRGALPLATHTRPLLLPAALTAAPVAFCHPATGLPLAGTEGLQTGLPAAARPGAHTAHRHRSSARLPGTPHPQARSASSPSTPSSHAPLPLRMDVCRRLLARGLTLQQKGTYDKSSESKPHVFIKQHDFSFKFHPIQIKYFLLSTGSLTSEYMFSTCS